MFIYIKVEYDQANNMQAVPIVVSPVIVVVLSFFKRIDTWGTTQGDMMKTVPGGMVKIYLRRWELFYNEKLDR